MLEAHFIDEHLLVLDKPAGELAVPGRGAQGAACLLARAQAQWGAVFVVHRLDMATSGLIVFARSATAQRALSMSFEQRAVAKRYIAVAHGLMADDAGSIDLPLAADWPNRPRQQVDHVAGKPSLTHWRVLSREVARDVALPCTRVELHPVTGRSHQLRVHLQAIGHAIVGDALYAPAHLTRGEPRLLLHASRLAFAHPASGQALAFDSAAPF